MPASYPTSILTPMTRGPLMSDTVKQSDWVERLQAEVVAIQATLGLNPQGGLATVVAVLNAHGGSIVTNTAGVAAHSATITSHTADLTAHGTALTLHEDRLDYLDANATSDVTSPFVLSSGPVSTGGVYDLGSVANFTLPYNTLTEVTATFGFYTPTSALGSVATFDLFRFSDNYVNQPLGPLHSEQNYWQTQTIAWSWTTPAGGNVGWKARATLGSGADTQFRCYGIGKVLRTL